MLDKVGRDGRSLAAKQHSQNVDGVIIFEGYQPVVNDEHGGDVNNFCVFRGLSFHVFSGYDVGAQQNENAGHRFVPGQHVLSDVDGYQRSDHGLQIGVNAHSGSG